MTEPAERAPALIRDAFKAHDPKLEAELSLGENNPDFRGLEDIAARHAYRHFKAGWLAAQSGWIPVSERLPPTEQRVLVCRYRTASPRKPYTYVDADIRRDKYNGDWSHTDGYEKVTHWMPLPQPPNQSCEP